MTKMRRTCVTSTCVTCMWQLCPGVHWPYGGLRQDLPGHPNWSNLKRLDMVPLHEFKPFETSISLPFIAGASVDSMFPSALRLLHWEYHALLMQVTLFSIHQFFAIQESLRSKLMINRSNLPTGCIETVGCERSDRQEVEEIACIARVPLGLL